MTAIGTAHDSRSGIALAPSGGMSATVWVSDRDAGVRRMFGELLAEADVLAPEELEQRLAAGGRPDAIVIDGTQLLELDPRQRLTVLARPRVLVCTGLLLASMPMNLISGPGVAVLAKPFCVEDLEAAVEWVRGAPARLRTERLPLGALIARRRSRAGRAMPAR